MSYRVSRGFMQDLDKTKLLEMRNERFMSNSQIAFELGCSQSTIYKLIGPMPKEMLHAKKVEYGYKGAMIKHGKDYQAEAEQAVKNLQQAEPEKHEQPEVTALPAKPEKGVLAVRPAELKLWGDFGCYTISEKRDQIDVENAEGRVLINVPAGKLDTFIAELQAIARNIGSASKHVEMW